MSPHSVISRRCFLDRGARACAVAAVLPGTSRVEAAADRWQIGCFTRPWAAHDYRVALDAVAEAGYRYVGLMTTNSPSRLVISVQTTPDEAQVIGEAIRARGLRAPSAYCGEIPVAEGLEAALAGMHRLIDNCAAAEVADVMMGGVGTEEAAAIYYTAIGEACDYAADKGIGISVKPHGGTNATGPACRALIDSVGKPNFRLWYDPGNIFYYSDGDLDPADDAGTVDGLVTGMSVKDYRHPKIVDLTPGTGQVDFPRVMARLRAGGFTSGPLIVETLVPGDLPQLLEEARKARAFVEGLVDA
jgi:sugar phosphate isomerase/epimerase